MERRGDYQNQPHLFHIEDKLLWGICTQKSQMRLLYGESGEEISVLTFPLSMLHTSPAPVFAALSVWCFE